MDDEKVFELIELALRGEADGAEALDALKELKTRYFGWLKLYEAQLSRW